MNKFRFAIARRFGWRLLVAVIFAASVIALFAVPTLAQQAPAHLNRAVAKLAAGQPVFGIEIKDLSLANARHIAQVKYDFVFGDFEHEPFNMTELAWFTAVMMHGRVAERPAFMARFPPYGRDQEGNDWFIKQALDIGLNGIIFNGVDNAEQARRVIQEMRYPPTGVRGYMPISAMYSWGVSEEEYNRRADVWPVNPNGDLLAVLLVETAEGMKNIDEIAAVPGVGAIQVGSGWDLGKYLNVPPRYSVVPSRYTEAMEPYFQKVLTACKAHNVACGISVRSQADQEQRLKEGWKMIRTDEILQAGGDYKGVNPLQ